MRCPRRKGEPPSGDPRPRGRVSSELIVMDDHRPNHPPGQANAAPTAPGLRPGAAAFVTAMIVLTVAVSAWTLALEPPHDAAVILVWSLAALASQLLVFSTPTRGGEVTL